MSPRLAHLALVLALGVGAAGGACLSAWDLGGPWACGADQTCAEGYTCDDGVCCKPGGAPTCPTLPAPNGSCATGEAKVWFEDRDGDGEGNARVSKVLCAAPLTGGWVLKGADCDDADLSINTAAAEACNGKDDNCDGVIDEKLPNLRPFTLDADGDGYGEDGTEVMACAAPPGMVDRGGDCAPFDPSKFPGAVELCNGFSDDCDSVPDSAETNFGDTGPAWPCLTGRPGRCADGFFQCVPQGTGVARQCEATRTPVREECNHVDDNCDGRVDEQPLCLGPQSIIATSGATYWAKRLTSTATLNNACQKGTAGVSEPATASTWTGQGSGFHVWAVEVPATAAWDLSAADAKLRLAFTASTPALAAAGGAWGNRTLGHPANPVIYLCGATDGEVIRYVAAAANDLSDNEMSFSSVLPLNGLSGNWITGRGSGFDTHRVRRIEVMLWNQGTADFTVTFSPDAGFFQ
jgi:hypothetical protein